jgi:TPR repeat protein
MKKCFLISIFISVFTLYTSSVSLCADFDSAHKSFESGNYAKALQEFSILAEQGNSSAMFYLGVMHEEGLGVFRDYHQALKWYTRAAKQGETRAQNNLGVMYEKGLGIPRDYKQALKWYTRAAEQGDMAAKYNLGVMYYKGEGVPQDYVLAHMWFHLAAIQGHEPSKMSRDILASKMTPDQIERSRELAVKWSQKHKKRD